MRTPLFQRHDLSAFWALFADNLANIVISTGVCLTVFQMPPAVVFGRILPGLGVALLVGLAYYAYLARRLAHREGRPDVTALPYGISTPVMFVYLFGVIGPAYWRLSAQGVAEAPVQAWRVGLAAAFVGGVVEVAGSAVGPWLKRVTPRAGMLGTLAGIAVVWIAAVPLAEIFEHPLVGFVSLAVVLAGLVGRLRMPFGVPAGLAAIAAGTAVALATGLSRLSFEGAGLQPPVPVVGDLWLGLRLLAESPAILAVVLPLAVYNFIETMNNVESAEAAGDPYLVRPCQVMDGVGTLAGSLFGSAFPTTVYIGHPAYKRLGAGAGYALGVGLVFFVASTLGLIQFLYHLIPAAAVAPILVFVGMVIAAQAFEATPAHHGLAVAVALIPHVSNLLVSKVGSVLQAAGREVDAAFTADLLEQGVHWVGQSALAQGSIVTGLVWGSLVAFLMDGRLRAAAAFAAAGAALTLAGVIHAPELGFHPGELFWGYTVVAALFLTAHLAGLRPSPTAPARRPGTPP